MTAIGQGLRAFHDSLPVDECPYSWRATERLERKLAAVRAGQSNPADWHPPYNDLTLDDALAGLADEPPTGDLVVCHGDACAPNTLLNNDGIAVGHVDLGALGVGERWADVAVASMSLSWNYGPGWEDAFYAAYGIDRDPEREAYFRLLWEVD